MTKETRQLLSEHNIYVSWGILGMVVSATVMITIMYMKIDAFLPIVKAYSEFDKRLTHVEYVQQSILNSLDGLIGRENKYYKEIMAK